MHPTSWTRSLARGATIAALLCCAAAPARAQIPDTFVNLKVLRKDISRQELIGVMRGFSLGLGVRCNFCHVGGDGTSLRGVDFKADSSIHKRKARFMLRMVRMLNDTTLAGLEGRSDPPVRVSCVTCHHGQSKPRQLDDVLAETVARAGADSAIAQYRDLRERYYGQGVFDFGPRSLNDLGETLARGGKMDEAIAMLKLNTEQNPDFMPSYEAIGDVYLLKKEPASAIPFYEKALELQPNNDRVKAKLERVRSGG